MVLLVAVCVAWPLLPETVKEAHLALLHHVSAGKATLPVFG